MRPSQDPQDLIAFYETQAETCRLEAEGAALANQRVRLGEARQRWLDLAREQKIILAARQRRLQKEAERNPPG